LQQLLDDSLLNVADVASPYIYIDDVGVGTRAEEGENELEIHDKALRRVLEIMKREKFVGDKRKAEFFVEELHFCGQILGHGVHRPAPGKLMAIEKWELPPPLPLYEPFWASLTNIVFTFPTMRSGPPPSKRN
jgi:hypothetical protein